MENYESPTQSEEEKEREEKIKEIYKTDKEIELEKEIEELKEKREKIINSVSKKEIDENPVTRKSVMEAHSNFGREINAVERQLREERGQGEKEDEDMDDML